MAFRNLDRATKSQREDARMDALAIAAWTGDASSARELLQLVASRIEDGMALTFYARRFIAPALRGIALHPTKAARILGVMGGKGVPGYGKDKALEVVFEIGKLRDAGHALKDGTKGAGAFSLAAEKHAVGDDYAEKEWKKYRKLAIAYGPPKGKK